MPAAWSYHRDVSYLVLIGQLSWEKGFLAVPSLGLEVLGHSRGI